MSVACDLIRIPAEGRRTNDFAGALVWREIGAFPAMRRLGIPEVLEFEHTSDDLPDPGIEFHVTRELAHPQQASRAMADLWTNDRARALDVAHWLG